VLWGQLRKGHQVGVTRDEMLREWEGCERRIEDILHNRVPPLPTLLVAIPSRIRWYEHKKPEGLVEVGSFWLENLEDHLRDSQLDKTSLCKHAHKINRLEPHELRGYLIRYANRHETLKGLEKMPDWYAGRWKQEPGALQLLLAQQVPRYPQ